MKRVLLHGFFLGLWTITTHLWALDPGRPHVDLPGQRLDDAVLLPNQWSLRPVGRQVPIGDLPVNIAVHPGGRFAAVVHCGYMTHEIKIIDLKEAKVASTQKVHEAFYGLEFSHNGQHLYCSGGSDEVIRVFDFKDGVLHENTRIKMRERDFRGIPGGMAVSADDHKLYVANVWGQRVSRIDLVAKTNLLDIFFAPGGREAADSTTTYEPLNPWEPELTPKLPPHGEQFDIGTTNAPFPYACRLDEKRERLYVSLWAQACVAVLDLKTNGVIARWPTGDHPNEMLLTKSGKQLFVANANHNTVTVFDTTTGKVLETLYSSLVPEALPGSTPNSLALSPDEKTLFVANACNNNIAVFDVSSRGKSRSMGFIPVGWYPTSVRVSKNGKQLLVANGKGLISKPNMHGPQPTHRKDENTTTTAEIFPGTFSIIDLPKGAAFEKQLAVWTAQAFRCTPLDRLAHATPSAGNAIPTELGKPSPIKYVIYIVKENRTYDQVFGDVPKGNGDPNLCLFPEKISPNHHKLAADFVLLDNFYADAEVSPDGHEWSMGAYATDFVEKVWPMTYGHNSTKYSYPAEGRVPIANPSNGYLWDRAKEAGVSYRNYGEFTFDSRDEKRPGWVRLPSLQGHFDPWYHGFDLDYSDLKRMDRFISELKRFEGEGEMPRLQIVRLPNDHTHGAVPGRLTPSAFVGENDLALGTIVDAVSHSKFWPQTAIFVVEDDAQNGPDHVDAHRTVAMVVSPYTKRGAVDSTMYSTTSMLHTIELILGLKPMTQFDSAAMPMFNSFQAEADLRPYDHLPANVDLNEKNSRTAWGSKASQKMDFSKEDAADDLLLNEIIWRSVRGANNPMPSPVRAAFVLGHKKDGDED